MSSCLSSVSVRAFEIIVGLFVSHALDSPLLTLDT